MTARSTHTLTPWILTLGAITFAMSIACGLPADDEEPESPAPDMSTAQPDMSTAQPDMQTPQPDMPDVQPEDMAMSSSNWTMFTHPCKGNRTDALFCDDDQTCFTGCGTTTEGRGMYMTSDGGATWDSMQTDPVDFFDQSRVNDIWRSPDDGKLYVAGEHNAGFRVVSVDDSGTIGEVFKAKSTVGFAFTPGSFRRGSSGRAIAESLNGTDLLYRAMDSDDPIESWLDGSEFANEETGGVQLLDLAVLGDDFYASGSTINQPPMAFMPAWDDTFDFDVVQFSEPGTLSAYTGEMWGIDVHEDGVVVGGVNQDADVGMIYTFNFEEGLSPSDVDNWTEFRVSTVIPDKSTWIQGVCRGDGVIYAVGRESREGWGFVLRSKDAGQTWEDISLYEGRPRSSFKDVSRCQVSSTGGVIIAGQAGEFAVYEE